MAAGRCCVLVIGGPAAGLRPVNSQLDWIEQADAPIHGLVLAVDAAEQNWQAQFESLKQFLAATRRHRAVACDVGRLPVLVRLPNGELREKARDAFAEWLRNCIEPAFGSLNVSIAESCEDSFEREAIRYAESVRASQRKLQRLSISHLLMVTALLALAAILFFAPISETRLLSRRIDAIRRADGGAGVRLSSARLASNKAALESVRRSPAFATLAGDSQTYILDRLAEINAYEPYWNAIRMAPFGPAEVESDAELLALEDSLASQWLLPPGYESSWNETDAAKLRGKWLRDLALLKSSAKDWIDWYRSLAEDAEALLREAEPDSQWHRRCARLPQRPPPHPGRGPIEGSPVLPMPRGEALDYECVARLDRVERAREHWLSVAERLSDYAELQAALGFAGEPAVLAWPAGEIPWNAATAMLKHLDEKFQQHWRLERFLEPGGIRAGTLLASLQSRGEDAVRLHLRNLPGDDTPEGWKTRFAILNRDEDFQNWGRLLARIDGWRGLNRGDPARELLDFLAASRWVGRTSKWKLSVPIDFRNRELTVVGPLSFTVRRNGQVPKVIEYAVAGPPERGMETVIYRFGTGERSAIELAPGDELTVKLPIKLDGEAAAIVWARGRSATFTADRPFVEPAPGVRLALFAEGDEWPALPRLLP